MDNRVVVTVIGIVSPLGLDVSTTWQGLVDGPSRISPLLIPAMIPNMDSGQVSIHLNAKGPNYTVASAGAGEGHSIGNDFVMGEGAAVLILESLDFARKQESPILAGLVGYGAMSDAYHITEPPEDGANIERAMRLAPQQASLIPRNIDCIKAHGTSTRLNDSIETRAIKSLFGEYTSKVPISANKSILGHLIGATGTISSVATVLTLKNTITPPMIISPCLCRAPW